MSSTEKVKITMVKSKIKLNKRQLSTVKGLGLRKISDSRIYPSTPEIMGMVEKIKFILTVEKIS